MFGRASRRRLRFGLSTVLGWRALGFFIPYRFADRIAPAPSVLPSEIFEARTEIFSQTLDRIAPLVEELVASGPADSPGPRWDQDWFAPLDAALAYGLVRSYRPRVIVEIGAGHSTRFMAQACRMGGLNTRHIAVDPEPGPAVRALARSGWIELLPKMLHEVDPAALPALGPGDILSLDGSHVVMPGTDTDIVFRHLLPRLPPGALFHVHDVFLPDPYPCAWHWRGYNEQNVLAALIAMGSVCPIFASHYVDTRLAHLTAAGVFGALPGGSKAAASSFWGLRA